MTKSAFPKTVSIGAGEFILRVPDVSDADAIHAFALGLPNHDLLYMRRDISKRPVVDAWLESVAKSESLALLAESEGGLIGMSGLMLDRKSWSPHVGEIRVLIGAGARGNGLGRIMIQETFAQAVAQGIEKIIAQMTLDQSAARAVFQELGFQQEALLRDHVRDRNGEDHDIVIMSCDVAGAAARMAASR